MNSAMKVLASTAFLLLVSVTVLGGCTGNPNAPQVTQSPQIPLSPAQAPATLASDCSTYATSYDRIPPTAAMLAKLSSAVVVGVVQDVGEAQWNTKDGGPPSDINDLNADHVMRLVRVETDQTLKGATPTGTFTVYVPGGSIGCDKFIDGDHPASLTPGDTFVFFLRDTPTRIALEGTWLAAQMWSVHADATIDTPAEGKLTLAQVVEEISATK
jgi:hypothetical protein